MPKAPRGKTTGSPPPEDTGTIKIPPAERMDSSPEDTGMVGAEPLVDLTIGAALPDAPEAAQVESPAEQAADAAEPVQEPVAIRDPEPEQNQAPAKAPTKRAPRKAAATRTNPKPVEGTPDASLPGGSAKKAVLEFGTLSDEEDYLNVLWYGPEGVGKTTAALKAANHGRVLVVSAEGGLKSRALKSQGIDTSQVTTWPPAGQEDLLTRDGLEALGYKIREDLAADPAAWFAVVWDSGSAVGDRILRQIVAEEVAKDAAKPAHLRKDFRSDPFFTDRSDYGTLSSQLVPLVEQYRDLRCHFLITALERRDVDDDTGQVMYGPVFTPAVSSGVRAAADLVLRVAQEEGEDGMVVVASTRPNPRYRAKDRFGATPIRMADPSFTRVLGYVEGSITEQDDTTQQTLPTGSAPAKSGKIKKEN